MGEGDELGLGAEESFFILNIAGMFGAKVEMRPETKGNHMGAKWVLPTRMRSVGKPSGGWRYIQGVTEQ